MSGPNDQLRQLRTRTESAQVPGEFLSRAELAEQVNAWVHDHLNRTIELDGNYIGKLERGAIRWPQADYRDGLRAVLGVATDAELGFRRSRSRVASLDTVKRSDFLRAALGVTAGAVVAPLGEALLTQQPTPVPSVVGQREVEQVRAAAQLFGTWDHTYGGGLVREAVAAQLRYSAGLLSARYSERLHSDLHSAVGFLGHTAAFMAFDAYAHEDARRMFEFALGCAEEANDWHLRAKVLSSMARQEIWCGNPDAGLTLVELAMVRADRLTASERAMLLTARARALAKLHRVSDAVTTVGLADEQFANASPDNDPVWMRYYDKAQHAGDTGHALFDLAVDGRFVGEARDRLALAVAGHSQPYARSRAISGIKLASLTMRAGDPVEAAQIGARALQEAGTITSRRAADDLRELRTFAQDHRRVSEVAELQSGIGDRLGVA
ncbi:XRE family transcriptional regulator [Amycolatopsis keratiniphila]|uniref:XRE family transcriptional regulator n=1 Tax=Amycolatopsis keratiniphila TaxID=129921 RepID=UPI001E30FFE4|nr:XRE family transcriptional regulator [Amycolatopsis keratiniphila]